MARPCNAKIPDDQHILGPNMGGTDSAVYETGHLHTVESSNDNTCKTHKSLSQTPYIIKRDR